MKKVGGLVATRILSTPTPIKGDAKSASTTPLRDISTNVSNHLVINSGDVPPDYPYKLSLYVQPPQFDLSIDDFEECALARLALLKTIDAAAIRGIKEDELRVIVKQAEQRHRIQLHSNNVARSFPLERERQLDHASHYILQLVFAGNAENRRWLVQQEMALLKARFFNDVVAERTQWLEEQLHYERVALARKQALLYPIQDASLHVTDIMNEEFFLIPWHHVPDLVGRKMVFIEDGMAYVPRSDAFSAIITRYRKQLEEYLDLLPQLKDNRVGALMEAIRLAEFDDEQQEKSDLHFSASEIDKLAVAHFPPCMQHLHRCLRRDGHMKYGGRQQYGIFLKAINVSMEEALMFWKRAFAPKINEGSFQKEYAYNIRHVYGMEGKRVPAPPQSCMRIIGAFVNGADETHGCPFKQFKATQLDAMLHSYAGGQERLAPSDVEEIKSLLAGRHYQMACTRLFNLTRQRADSIDTITHPHLFFAASLKAARSRDDDF